MHSHWPIAEIIEDTIVLFRLKLAQSKIHLRFEAPPRSMIIDVHKGQLQQVLLILMINSTQAMPEGGQIVVNCHSDEHRSARLVQIDLSDTGPGIPENLRSRFGSLLCGRPNGSESGLAIAKRILTSYHGDITLLATSSAGTSIRITLPLA